MKDPFKGKRGVDWFVGEGEKREAKRRMAKGLPPIEYIDNGCRHHSVQPVHPRNRRQRHQGDAT